MRSELPLTLDGDELKEYLTYLIVCGILFIVTAILLYITLIVLTIVSKKCVNTRRIMEYEQLHPTKAHVRLANISSGAGIFGLVVNTQLHSNVNSVMTHPKELFPPVQRMVIGLNATISVTTARLGIEINNAYSVLNSISNIARPITHIHNMVMNVVNMFNQVGQEIQHAHEHIDTSSAQLSNLSDYETSGFIDGVPSQSELPEIDSRVDAALDTSSAYLNSTVDSINNAVIIANSSIQGAVATGREQIDEASSAIDTMSETVSVHLTAAVRSVDTYESTVATYSELVTRYEYIRAAVVDALFVFGLIPVLMILIGTCFKKRMLFRLAIISSMLVMFWLFVIGGIHTILQIPLTQACAHQEELLDNVFHKLLPAKITFDIDFSLGDNSSLSEITILLDSPTIHKILSCDNPTSLLEVTKLNTVLDSAFSQIYSLLDKLLEEQSKIANQTGSGTRVSRNIYEMSDTDNTTDDIPDENINSQLNETIYQLRLFGQESSNINISVVEVDHVTQAVQNVSDQAQDKSTSAQARVNAAMYAVNNMTSNVTTISGYEFAYFYAETNVTRLNISNYPYSDTASDYKSQLTVLKSQALAAIQNRDQINQIVNVVSEISDTILKELSDFKGIVLQTQNATALWNQTIQEIAQDIETISTAIPNILSNVTQIVGAIRGLIAELGADLNVDTQCGWMGEFYASFSTSVCAGAAPSVLAVGVAQTLMGFAYFGLSLLGVGLLKQSDVDALMIATADQLKKLADSVGMPKVESFKRVGNLIKTKSANLKMSLSRENSVYRELKDMGSPPRNRE